MCDSELIRRIIYWRFFKCKSYTRERKAWVLKNKEH